MPPANDWRTRRSARPSIAAALLATLLLATGCQSSDSDDTSVSAFSFDAPLNANLSALPASPPTTPRQADQVNASSGGDDLFQPGTGGSAEQLDDPLFGAVNPSPAGNASTDLALVTDDALFGTGVTPGTVPATTTPAPTEATSSSLDIDAVTAAAKRTLDQDGARFASISQAHMGGTGGSEVPIAAQGTLRFRDGSGELTVQGATVPTGGPVDPTAPSVDLRYNHDVLLVSTGAADRRWIRVERGFGTVPAILHPLGVSIGIADPVALLRGLQGAVGPVQDLGPATSKGVDVERVRVFVDAGTIVTAPDRAFERLVPFEVMIDAAGLVRELHLALTHSPSIGQTEHLTIAQGFYDFGPQPAQSLPPETVIVAEPPTTRPTTTQPPLVTSTTTVTIPGPGNTAPTAPTQGAAVTIAAPGTGTTPPAPATTKSTAPAPTSPQYTVPPPTNPPLTVPGTPTTLAAL